MKVFVAAIALLLVTGAAGQALRDEETAAPFTPAYVREDVAKADAGDARVTIAVARADLDRSGSADYLVAAYGGEETGALRVLRLAPSPVVVADAPQPVGGRGISLRLIDVETDGIPEIAVFALNAQAAGPRRMWVYRWTGGGLESLFEEPVPECTFEDLDGDGRLEAIAGAFRSAGKTMPRTIYELSGGKYVRAGNRTRIPKD